MGPRGEKTSQVKFHVLKNFDPTLMNIVLTSHSFYPAIGGIETMSLLLAYELIKRGHHVKVLTHTKNKNEDHFPFDVIRAPTPVELIKAVKWCDVYFQNNISVRMLWPIIIFRRPWIVRHATWISRMDGSLSWRDWVKRFLLRYSVGISNSQAIADHISTHTNVIGNPYRDELFCSIAGVDRSQDLVFLGRLVSDKGASMLLSSLVKLRDRGLRPTLTVIGDGPELGNLQQFVSANNLNAQVTFVGQRTGMDLVTLLNRHRIMVVPSIWKEPFGIVALEGIACGCAVVGSTGGGLRDAIGPCGLTFENGNVAALTAAIESLLCNPEKIRKFVDAAPEHLVRHTTNYVVDRYLEIIVKSVRSKQQKI